MSDKDLVTKSPFTRIAREGTTLEQVINIYNNGNERKIQPAGSTPHNVTVQWLENTVKIKSYIRA